MEDMEEGILIKTMQTGPAGYRALPSLLTANGSVLTIPTHRSVFILGPRPLGRELSTFLLSLALANHGTVKQNFHSKENF